MNNINNIYTNYSDLKWFDEEKVSCKYQVFYQEAFDFLKIADKENQVRIDDVILTHAVLDYFADVSRLKQFHGIEHINEIKVISYETYWLLRRKPLQVTEEVASGDMLAFINEKFAFSRLSSFLLGNRIDLPIKEANKKAFMNFLDTLYYYLKYRQYDAQVIELLILGFKAGSLLADEN